MLKYIIAQIHCSVTIYKNDIKCICRVKILLIKTVNSILFKYTISKTITIIGFYFEHNYSYAYLPVYYSK